MPLIKVVEACCIVCHRNHFDCNCLNQIKWYGLEAVKEYNERIKNGERFWGYQQFYQQLKHLPDKQG